jgi:hypothetical protein
VFSTPTSLGAIAHSSNDESIEINEASQKKPFRSSAQESSIFLNQAVDMKN